MTEQLSHTWWLILVSVTSSVAWQMVIKFLGMAVLNGNVWTVWRH